MIKLIVGTDEVASGTQQVDGYAYVVLPAAGAAELAGKTKAILANHGLDVFHARKFDPAHTTAYSEFLSAVRDAVLGYTPSKITLVLHSAGERDRITAATTQLMAASYAGNHQNDPKLINTSKLFVPQLVTLQRVSADLPPDSVADIEIDRDDRLDVLAKLTGVGPAASLSAAAVLRAFYHAHRRIYYPTAPEMGELRVLPDEQSAIVQAADVIGNFAMAHGFVCLGASSVNRTTRATLLESILDLDGATEFFRTNVDLQGNDLVLKKEGAIRLDIFDD